MLKFLKDYYNKLISLNNIAPNAYKKLLLLLAFITTIILMFIYNPTFIDDNFDEIMMIASFITLSLLEILYYSCNNIRIFNIVIYSILTNTIIGYYFYTLFNYYACYKKYILNHEPLYIYTFTLNGTSLCSYKIKTFWIEQITILIVLGLLLKYVLYIIFNFKKYNNSNLLSTKFNFTIILIYLIFSGYFTTVKSSINIYYSDKLYTQKTYDNLLENIIFQLSEDNHNPVLNMRERALINFDIMYAKPNNSFTKILKYIFKERIDTDEAKLK